MAISHPSNVHTIQDPTFTILLDQLRDRSLKPSTIRTLVHDAASTIAQNITLKAPGNETLAIIVVLRSGLAMFEGFMKNVPAEVSTAVYHMGIFRDESSLQPVEYYNKLPTKPEHIKQAIVLDPLIATGGTAGAVVDILREWGIDKITFLSLLSTPVGLDRAAKVWPESTEFVVGAVDPGLDDKGYIEPGVGDIGDRLFGTSF
ncbi:uracil phosphoribosyltransferase [Aspergillus affinis]|uniref:uracil phosphoribosyltransferase n=1 Tax=Aspergillus affinis TaxID=1070780 RepID=UPI0022FEC0E0|nr:PRTase-like protein [Aspergillus affinis]KAI9035352.1 PRTase-like protein [Aspergillus affinis]